MFIRSIQTHPNPLFLVLATATQFQNLETHCTSQYVSSVMTIDPTFNIDNFSVTPVTYQDLLLISKRTGEHLICIRPLLISQNLTYDVFSDIYYMQMNCPSLKQGLQSFGTDGEKALEKALAEGFPDSVEFRCMSHFRNNIKEHLKDFDAESKTKVINHDKPMAMESIKRVSWMLTRQSFSKAFMSQLGAVGRKYLILLCLGLIVKSPLSKSRCLQMSEMRQAWVPHQQSFTPIALRVTIMLLSTKSIVEKFPCLSLSRT